jgi:pimeloyl-ACP methyl ester carboxylesterase
MVGSVSHRPSLYNPASRAVPHQPLASAGHWRRGNDRSSEGEQDVTVDVKLLEAHSSRMDERIGISERFLRLRAGGAETLGVLALPLGERRGPGWVVCHSFASEQVDLHMLDVALGRSLAAAGHPTLRFHAQGYGDSGEAWAPAAPSTQLRDTLEVIEQFGDLAEVEGLGLVGARFGGTVAALVAGRTGASHLVLLHPIVSGPRYAAELLRSRVIVELLGERPSEATTVEQLKDELAMRGVVSIKGWPLRRDAYDELRAIDLMKEMDPFSGRALVVQVSRGSSVQRAMSRLQQRLRELGAEAELEVVTHPSAPNFGYEHFRPVAKEVLGDILEGVNQALIDRTLGWLGAGTSAEGRAG